MSDEKNYDDNRDPITGETGSHPIGTGVGAAVGGAGGVAASIAAGAATGMAVGPIGAAIGAAIGAVAGGLLGKAAAEAIDPTEEDSYWRDNYTRQPYYEQGRKFDDYEPGYAVGYWGRTKYEGRNFDDVESDLESEYNRSRGNSGLDWQQNRHAARAAWDRADSKLTDYNTRSGTSSVSGTTGQMASTGATSNYAAGASNQNAATLGDSDNASGSNYTGSSKQNNL